MGNHSCYSRRTKHNFNRSSLPNTSTYHSNRSPTISTEQKYLLDLLLASYCNIEVLTNDRDDDEECAICFEPFCQGEFIARLQCLCIYHQFCLEQWNERRLSCPVHMDSIIERKIIVSSDIKEEMDLPVFDWRS